MRCSICDNKLKRIIPDTTVRGGIRPCSACQGVIGSASLNSNSSNSLLGYDDSDVQVDIKEVVGSALDNDIE